VYEAGQLWTVSHEAAQALRKGSIILLGLLQAQALLIYPLIIPRDLSPLFRAFKRVGPLELPFAETLKGEKVYMQAMLLEGGDLRRQVQLASYGGFETRDGHTSIRFGCQNTDAGSSSGSRLHLVIGGSEVQTGQLSERQPNRSELPVAGLASSD
jgi:hypothetical protein